MQAVSILGTLREVRGVVSDRRDLRTVAEDGEPAAAYAHEWVCHLVDLCLVGIPLPPLDRTPPPEADRVVADEMEDMYGWGAQRATDGGWDPDAVDADIDDWSGPVEYHADERLRQVDGTRVIPLRHEGPAAANWYVLFDLLPTYLTAVATDCRTLAERNRIDDSPSVADEWDSIGDLLGALGSTIDHNTSMARWVHVPDRETVDSALETRSMASELTKQTRNLR